VDRCSGRGACDNGVCQCIPGYIGDTCTITACPNDCFNELGNGYCTGTYCECYSGYYDLDCGVYFPETIVYATTNATF